MLSGPSLTVLSLSGGVQSSVMALMVGERAFDRTSDCAIFADTLWEPPIVYEHIEWLRDRLSFPLHVVDNGRSCREDLKAVINHSGSRSYVDIPVFLKGRDGEADGIGRRQCTTNYKVMPIRRKICMLLGLRKGQRVPSTTHRRSVAWHPHRRGRPNEGLTQPLDGESLSLDWGGDVTTGLHRLVVVPVRQAAGTLGPRLDRGWPDLFAEAVETDAKMRDGLAFAKEPYLHSLRTPLDEAVALDEAKLGGEGQRDGFGDECEGHCGV